MLNIKAARKKKGYTQTQVSKIIGISQTGYSDWETGKNRIDADSLNKLAALFGTSVDYLLGNDQTETAAFVRIPVLGSIPAGIPLEAVEDIVDWEDIPAAMTAGGKEYFALRVKGDSMWPNILPGDTVIIRRCQTCSNHDICVVFVNGYDCTLKEVELNDEDRTLTIRPHNSSYPPTTFTAEEIETLPVTIGGVVVELRRKIR